MTRKKSASSLEQTNTLASVHLEQNVQYIVWV